MNFIDNLRATLQQKEARQTEIMAAANERVMSAEEKAELEQVQADISALNDEISLRQKAEGLKAELAAPQRRTNTEIIRPALSIVSPSVKDKESGFRSFGHFLSDVRAYNTTGRKSEQLQRAISLAATTYQSEGTAADGGVLVPTDFRRDIHSYVLGQTSLVGMTDQYNSLGTTISFPFDEVQSFTGTLSFARTAEAGVIGESKATLGNRTVTAYKAAAIVNLTDELAEDNALSEQWVTQKVADKITNNINHELFYGAGTGSMQALGVLSASCLKTVVSASGQGAGTIVEKNIRDMYYSMPAEDRGTACWCISPDVEPFLPGLVISGTTIPAYLPPGGLSSSPYATLYGRPVYVLPWLPAVGTKGDILFCDWKRYLTLFKGPVKTDFTIAAYFNQGLQTYRFTIRWGGTPWPSQVITFPGGATRSPFVTLAAR